MHVLYIHQHFGTPAGSSGTRSYEFALRLIAAGHRVTMVCGASGRSGTGLAIPFAGGRREGAVDGIDVVEFDVGYATTDGIGARIVKFLRFGAAATRIALTGRYDLVFATSTPLTAAIPGILARRLRGTPFVFEVRDLWPELPKALGVSNPLLLGGMSALEWLAYNNADRTIGLAPGIVQGIERRRKAADRPALIPNACDVELFARHTGDAPFAPFGDHVAPGDFTCVYAGAHGLANGLDALLPVAETLKARGRDDIKLLLIGAGATKAPLQAAVRQRGLEALILFADGMPKTQLIPLLKAADAGLQILKNVPAFYEGTSPNKFFDYLAAGIPVIVNYPGWIAQLTRDHDCGAAVPPDDPHAFADALERAAANRPAWRAKGANAARLAAGEFDRNRLGDAFVAVLEQAAGHGAASNHGANLL